MKVYKMFLNCEKGPCVYLEESLDGVLEELKHTDVGNFFKVEVAEMTQAEIDELPEFDGW